MKVLKFGGSSVGDAERIRIVKKITENESLPLVVVVSAFRGVTDALKIAGETAARHDPQYKDLLEEIIKKHRTVCNELLPVSTTDSVRSVTEGIFTELNETLNGLFLLRELSNYSLDKLLSAGERLSSLIISAYFKGSTLIDAREIIKTDNSYGNANVDLELTSSLIKKSLSRIKGLVVSPGFIAATNNN
jgi:aspartokinase/homoserine dehydrogenase 1